MIISSPVDNVQIAPPWSRPDSARFSDLSRQPAAIVGDALDRMTAMDGTIRRLSGSGTGIGTALPIEVRAGDNLAVHRAMDEARPGDILVINSRGDTTRAIIGDLLGEMMVAAGVKGAVVDGAARDIADLSDQGLHVFARSVTPAGPFKHGPGSVGSPVAVGGVVVCAGDVIVGDDDGVVVVPQARIDEVTSRVATVAANEETMRERIHAEWSVAHNSKGEE